MKTLNGLDDGIYRVEGADKVIGMPQGYYTGYLINIGSNSYIKIQVFLAHKEGSFYRINVDGSWYGWFKLPTTGVPSIV